ncbi:MAG: aldo/keto reductase [Anaerostipes hadrus]
MFKLNNEIQIPEIGLGVYNMEAGKEMNDAVKYAYQSGYSLYDTAQMYKNEQSLGDALKENKIPREDIFLISFCKENDIQIMAWGPLLRGNLENKK